MLGLLKVTQMENLMFEGSKFFLKNPALTVANETDPQDRSFPHLKKAERK